MTSTDRVSIKYFSDSFPGSDPCFMFIEDFYQHIVPIYGVKHDKVQCSIIPHNPNFEATLVDLLPYTHQFGEPDFKDAILDTIQEIAYHVVHHGSVVWEFVRSRNEDGDDSYKLEVVRGDNVVVKKKFIVQELPDEVVKKRGCPRVIKIPRTKCFIIRFPETLGGYKKYIRFLSDFRKLEQDSKTRRYLKNPLAGFRGYDIKEHNRAHSVALYRKSKLFMWDHRDSRNEMLTSYYNMHRRFSFGKTRIMLRDHLIQELERIVSELSTRFGEKAMLKIEGLPSLDSVMGTLSKWESGELDVRKFEVF